MEAMIAVFVLTIGIITVFHAFSLGIKVEKLSKMATVASQLGQGKIEEIIAEPYDEISIGTTTEDSVSSPFESYKRVTVISWYDPDNPGQPSAGDLGIKKVITTVSWGSPLNAAKKNIEIITLINRH